MEWFALALAIFIVMGLRGKTGGFAGPWLGFGVVLLGFAPVSVSQLGINLGLNKTVEELYYGDGEAPERLPLPTASYRIPRGEDGHYRVSVRVNGHLTRMIVDTGATGVVLKYEDAVAASFDLGSPIYGVPLQTANGVAYGVPIYIGRMAVGDIERKSVAGYAMRPGALSESLLGMSFLSTLGRYEVRGGNMFFVQ